MNSSHSALSRSLLRCTAPFILGLAAHVGWAAPGAAPAASGAGAASTARSSDEGARIAQEREVVEARFLDRERECQQRFIVTSCLDEAKAERRRSLDRLRARQLVIDEERRRGRSEARKAELAEKAAEDARRERVRAAHLAAGAASDAALPTRGRPLEPRPAESVKGPPSGPRDRVRSSGSEFGLKPPPREPAALREQREAASRAAFEAKQAEAAAHRKEAIERTTRRMAQQAPAASLPVAASAAAARAASRP